MAALHTSRRSVIAATASILLSGCTVIGTDGSEDDSRHSDTAGIREVIVTSYREEPVRLAVRVETEDGDDFSHVYALSPDEYDDGESVDGVPHTVTAFTADGTSNTWDQIPTSRMICDAPDIEIAVRPAELSLSNPC